MNCPESDEEPKHFMRLVRIGGENRWMLYDFGAVALAFGIII